MPPSDAAMLSLPTPTAAAQPAGAQALAGRILVLALAYFVAGRAGLLLTVPPGYASALWPPAGIALVLLLAWGARAAPGVWLGSFCLNLQLGADAAGALSWTVAAVAAGIGAGATLQAWLGAALVRCFAGYPNALDQGRSVLRFLVLGGPLACVVGASAGVAALCAGGLVLPHEAAFNWWAWWVGDTIGVLLGAPVLLTFTGQPRPVWRARRRTVALPLLVAAGAVTVVFLGASRQEDARIRLDFEARAAMLAEAVADQARHVLDAPALLAGLFSASAEVTRDEFATYVQALRRRLPAVQAMEWVPRVHADALEAHEAALRAEGLTDYAVREQDPLDMLRPVAPRASYFPVTFVEPMAGNGRALGFDFGSDPVRRALLRAAQRSDAVHVSPALRLVQARDDGATVLAAAKVAGANGEARGYTVAVIRPDRLVQTALHGQAAGSLQLRLEDLSAAPYRSLLYRSDPAAASAAREAPYAWSREFDAGGRRWLVTLAPQPSFLAARRSWAAWTVLAGGLFLSAMLGAFLLVLTGRATRVSRLVQARTAQLSEANRSLLAEMRDRARAEAALQRNRDQLAAVSRLQDGFIRAPDSPRVFDALLAALQDMTGSAGGVLGEVVYDAHGAPSFRLHAPADAAPLVRRVDALLRAVMDGAAPLIVNDPEPDAGGMPLRAFLGLPIRHGDALVGVVGLVDRDGGFEVSQAEDLAPLLSGYGQIIMARRAEQGRRSAEQSLRESEQRFRRLADTVPVFIWLADAGGRVTYANDTWRVFMGRAHSAQLGPFPDEALHPDDAPRVRATLADAVRAGRPFRVDCRVLRHDGEFRHLAITGTPRSPVEGEAAGYVISGHDVTPVKEAEAQLRRHHDELTALVRARTADLEQAKNQAEAANEAKAAFLANMSHELRTPLHAILSFATLGEKRIDGGDRDRLLHYFRSIHRSGDRLLALFADLLDLSKMEAGKLVLQRNACNLALLAADVMREFEVLAAQRQVCLTLAADPRQCALTGDGQRLTQVLRNLLSNAVKFSPDGSCVTVSVGGDGGDGLVLRVADQGVGVPAEELDVIFQPFVQSSRTRTGAGGTGLGLAICADIVRAHGGRIHATNLARGGCEFAVWLPVAPR